MSRLGQAIRSHRETVRLRRELDSAIVHAASPALRDELVLIAQRQLPTNPNMFNR